MCGIVGYTGRREALPLLLDSLRRVTYRGYDSFGVAVLNGTGIELQRRVGPVDQPGVEFRASGTVGIGHTRWATVGDVTEANAHPHLDCTSQLAIVHNGDIENYQALRSDLLERGHRLKSSTDSELIAHLLEEEYERWTLSKALARVSRLLEGSHAIAVIDYRTQYLAVIRQSSPVVIGVGAGEAFVASDAPAIIPFTNEVIYPDDGEVVLLRPEGVKVFRGGVEVGRPVTRLEWAGDDTELAGFNHYMIKEIYDQPRAIRETLAGLDRSPIELPVRSPTRVVMLACGSSYHAALMAEEMLRKTSRIPVDVIVASEYVHRGRLPTETLVIAISQSGETADTLNAARELKAYGHKIVGITNVRQSSLARISDTVLYTHAGPEVAVAATKTLTTQLVVLSLLAEQLIDSAGPQPAAAGDVRLLPNAVQQVLERSEDISDAGRWLAAYENLFVVARGANYPVAMEAALKLKECAYIHAEGVPAGELKHGAFALLSKETPVLAFIDDDLNLKRMITAIREIKARGGPIVVIGNAYDPDVSACADKCILLPRFKPALAPILNTVASQLIAYSAAIARGCPVDRPRNLAKSVTVL